MAGERNREAAVCSGRSISPAGTRLPAMGTPLTPDTRRPAPLSRRNHPRPRHIRPVQTTSPAGVSSTGLLSVDGSWCPNYVR